MWVLECVIQLSYVCPLSSYMKEFDPFQSQKESSFVSSLTQISSQAARVCRLISSEHLTQSSEQTLRVDFEHLVLVGCTTD